VYTSASLWNLSLQWAVSATLGKVPGIYVPWGQH
jgi:hypothetical protein